MRNQSFIKIMDNNNNNEITNYQTTICNDSHNLTNHIQKGLFQARQQKNKKKKKIKTV